MAINSIGEHVNQQGAVLRFSAVLTLFLALAVGIPTLAHQLDPMAGRIYLPMHALVMAGAILFGWRFGLLLGLLSPLVSHALTGMPPAPILGSITIEVGLYGLLAGILSERTKWHSFFVVLGSVILGRIAILAVMAIQGTGPSPFDQILQAAQTGWPGIAIQLILLPLVLPAIHHWMKPTNHHESSPNQLD